MKHQVQGITKGFLAVRASSSPKELRWGRDIFTRPMPWGLWLKAIFPHKKNPWRFVRVMDLPAPIEEYTEIVIEAEEVVFDNEHHYKLERPNLLLIIEWIAESLYYGTALRFWNWPAAQAIRDFFSHF